MAITISGVNNNDRIVASDGTIDALSGFNVVGVMTAASFSGDLIGNVTGNVTGNINNTTLLLQTSGTERIRITGNNEIGIAGANYGSAGQVLTSGGSGSAVSWTTISGGVTSDSQENTIGGTGAGDNLDSDTYRNTLFGYQAGEQINSGDDNTLVGWKAADKLTSGYKNCAFGSEALEFLTSGYDNVAMGWEAGRSCNGDGNTMIGNMAGRSMSGSENIAIGDHAYSNGGGTRSIGIGGESVWLGGTDVIGIGKYTMARGGSQIGGIGIGYHAGRNNAGDHNVYIGYQAGYGTGSSPYAIGNYNISLGYRSLYSVTSASSNVAIGASAGDVLTTGGNNIILGDGADASSATVSNEITLGNSSITKFRIPGLDFEVGGPYAAMYIGKDTNNLLMLDNSTSSTQKMFFAQNGSTHAQLYATSTQGSLIFESDPSDAHNDSLMNFTIDGSSKLRINNTGLIALDNSTAQICIRDSGVVDNAIFYIGGGTRTQTSTTTDFTQICLYDKNSQYNTQTANGSWKSKIKFFAAQMNGGAREGAFIGQDTTYNNFSGSTIKMRSDLIFGTRGDAQTSSSDPATEKLRIRHNGQVQISEPAGSSGDGASLKFFFDNNNSTDVISQIAFANNVGEVAHIQGETRNGNTNGMITFHTDISGSSAEKFRVNHDGGFCYGTDSSRTAEFTTPDGFSIRYDDKGQFQNSVTNTTGGLMNRKGSDGDILSFRKDGAGVGHIGVNASTMYLNFDASSNADNQLDDYEEGTWTPTAQSGGSSVSVSSATYTKIGRIVHIQFRGSLNGVNGNTVLIGGLPFANLNNKHQIGPIMHNGFDFAGSTEPTATSYITSTWTQFAIYYSRTNSGGWSAVTGNDTGADQFITSLTYFTA